MGTSDGGWDESVWFSKLPLYLGKARKRMARLFFLLSLGARAWIMRGGEVHGLGSSFGRDGGYYMRGTV